MGRPGIEFHAKELVEWLYSNQQVRKMPIARILPVRVHTTRLPVDGLASPISVLDGAQANAPRSVEMVDRET
jgi:hypothetical protein